MLENMVVVLSVVTQLLWNIKWVTFRKKNLFVFNVSFENHWKKNAFWRIQFELWGDYRHDLAEGVPAHCKEVGLGDL